MEQLFPMGIAKGEAFCNRTTEKKILFNNIHANKHTTLLAPRRYGKTSLITQVISDSKLRYCEMDFLLSATAKAVQDMIFRKTGELLMRIMPRTTQARRKILYLFRSMRPEIVLSAMGQQVTFYPSDSTGNIENNISEMLLNLDKAAHAAKKRVIIFMDEFQQIGQLKDQHVIEASIRHAVERSQSVCYLFSGSNRHMLQQMFSDKNRPFYRLCSLMHVKRIAECEHINFINKAAKNKWKKPLSDETLAQLIELSECHSYYINLICNHFWVHNQYPTKALIINFWHDYLSSQQHVISYDISRLSNNQKIVLAALAKKPINQPYGKEFMLMTELTIASLKEALKKLLLKDFVYVDEYRFVRVLDPAMKSYILALI